MTAADFWASFYLFGVVFTLICFERGIELKRRAGKPVGHEQQPIAYAVLGTLVCLLWPMAFLVILLQNVRRA